MIYLIPGQHIHIIGIGGTGMSAIARVLLEQGFNISGSDAKLNALTDALERDGASVYEGHHPANIAGAEMVLVSSSINTQNPEIAAALSRNIPVYKRSDIIGTLMSGQAVIGVAGTHGKTTTTGMVTHILRETGQQPSYIVGGTLNNTNTNAGVGAGRAFVIEADEYDYMFLGLKPNIAIITNVEYDHPDFFTTPEMLYEAFRRYAALVPSDGLLVMCADSLQARAVLPTQNPPNVLTYGVQSPTADWRAVNLRMEDDHSVFEVQRGEQTLGTVRLQLFGAHNVANALAALIAADAQGVAFADAAAALTSFTGSGRRFEVRGELHSAQGTITVLDDYAHHPTAIRATLEAVRARYPNRAVWAVWQPHTYSRTQALLGEYLSAFTAADAVLVTDVYGAREQATADTITSAQVVAQIKHRYARHTPKLIDALDALDIAVSAPAVIVVMSAGDANQICSEFLNRRQARANA
jgi:UDP-N-acetylmuramate--alanine ligase